MNTGTGRREGQRTRGRGIGPRVRKLSIVLFGGMSRSRRSSSSVVYDPHQAMKNSTSQMNLLDKLTQHWYIDNTARMCTDVPRLVNRVRVNGPKQSNLWSMNDVENAGETHAATISLIKAMLVHLEEEEIVNDIIAKIDAAVEDQKQEQLVDREFLQKIFNIVGRTSRVYRIMKCLHQDYVLIGTTDFKLNMMKGKLTKDVRSDDGWQILITLADYIQIVHVRKEQSIDMPGEEQNHFEITYSISMTFDRNMDEMTAAQLKISELVTHPEMDHKVKIEVDQMFGKGNLIVQ